jgi:uncharacterized coiled-coil protein SlyX
MGIDGFSVMQDLTEETSAMKSRVDESKTVTLPNTSCFVAELRKKIARRRAQLAPLIEQLQLLRLQAVVSGVERVTLIALAVCLRGQRRLDFLRQAPTGSVENVTGECSS